VIVPGRDHVEHWRHKGLFAGSIPECQLHRLRIEALQRIDWQRWPRIERHDSFQSMHDAPRSTSGWRTVAVIAVVLLLGIGASRVLDGARQTSSAPTSSPGSIVDEPFTGERVLATTLFPSAAISDATGQPVPLSPRGEASIVMISSTSCGYCKQSLAELGELTKGRPVPGLRVLTLEGAADGAPMLAAAGVTGAVLIGPGTDAAKVGLTFRIQGTPTFVAIDRNGLVRRIMPGYPGPGELRRWLPVMTGSASWRDDS
jgi:hypothetical protein